MGVKSSIYKGLRVWNDVDSVRRGKVGKRVARRALGKGAGKLIKRLTK